MYRVNIRKLHTHRIIKATEGIHICFHCFTLVLLIRIFIAFESASPHMAHAPNSSGAAKQKESAVVECVTMASKCRADPKSVIWQ